MAGFVQILREFVQSEIRGIYTISFVRVEEVNEQRRAVVSLKSDSDILIDNVPIGSVWARNGSGVIVPVQRGDEGLVLHPQEPMEKQIQKRGEQSPGSERRFQLEDAVFMPMVWLDEDDVPEHEPGELVLSFADSELGLRMNPETGEFKLLDGSGYGVVSDGQGNIEWFAESIDVKDESTEF